MWNGHSSSSAAPQSTHLIAHMFTCIKNEPVTSALCRRNQRKSTRAKHGQMIQHKMLRLRPIRPSSACQGHFIAHLNRHAHPGMDAALKTMFTFRQTRDLDMAALKDSSLGHREVRKAAVTFGNRGLSVIEPVYITATELCHLGEGVRLAALADYAKNGSLLDAECVRFEVPVGVRSSSLCLRKQFVERRECPERDILAEVSPKLGIEGGRIAFIQGHDLCETW